MIYRCRLWCSHEDIVFELQESVRLRLAYCYVMYFILMYDISLI